MLMSAKGVQGQNHLEISDSCYLIVKQVRFWNKHKKTNSENFMHTCTSVLALCWNTDINTHLFFCCVFITLGISSNMVTVNEKIKNVNLCFLFTMWKI